MKPTTSHHQPIFRTQRRPRFAPLLIPFLAAGLLTGLHAESLPSWTSTDGRVMKAKFVKLSGESVVLEKDGEEVTIPFAKLKPASVAQAKELGAPPPPKQQTGPLKLVPHSGKTPPPVEEPKVLECQNANAWRPTPYLMNGEEFPFDAEGNLLLLKGSNADPGVLKLSGATGKPMWTTPAGRLKQIKQSQHFKVTGSSMYLVGQTATSRTMVSDPAGPLADLALACISFKDGAVSWTQTYDAPQKGEESGYKLLTDRAGNLVIVVDSKMPPTPVSNPQDRAAKTASDLASYRTTDTIVARFSKVNGKLLSEGKVLSIPGQPDTLWRPIMLGPDQLVGFWDGYKDSHTRFKQLVCCDLIKDTILWRRDLSVDSFYDTPKAYKGGVLVVSNLSERNPCFSSYGPDGSPGPSLTIPGSNRNSGWVMLGESMLALCAPSKADQSLSLTCYDARLGGEAWRWDQLVPKDAYKADFGFRLLAGNDTLLLAWTHPDGAQSKLGMAAFNKDGRLLWTRLATPVANANLFWLKLDRQGNPVLLHETCAPSPTEAPQQRNPTKEGWAFTKYDRVSGEPVWQTVRKKVIFNDDGAETSFEIDASGNVLHFWIAQGERGLRVTKLSSKDGHILWESAFGR